MVYDGRNLLYSWVTPARIDATGLTGRGTDMLFARKDGKGEILALFADRRPGTDPVAENDPALLRFLASAKSNQSLSLEQSDLALARVLEDLVALLVDKKVIRMGDLPLDAQSKLVRRKRLRGELAALGPFGPGADKLI